MEDHVKFEYNQITEEIFIGTNQCCTTHFKQELLDKGVSVDISLEEERLDAPFGIETFLWLPTKDHYPPTTNNLWLGVQIIKEVIEQGRKMYVHCKNGHTRAPTLVAAYLIHTGMKLEEAKRIIKNKRPGIHIMPPQIEALKEFEKRHG